MQKEKKFWGKLKLLNPRNLEKEVYVYGYHFSWKSHILLMLGTLAGIGAVGILFRLQAVYFAVLVAAVLFALPVVILDMYKKMYEQKRFGDTAAYMEQLLYSFQKSGKAASALKETLEIFEDGQMKRIIGQAIYHMGEGKPETKHGVMRESLQFIENAYSCVKVHMVHELLINAEEYGGETEEAVVILLGDIERWKKRGYHLQAEKKKSHMDNIVSIVVAALLCATALYVLNAMKQMFAVQRASDIFRIPVIQLSSFLFLLFLLYVFMKSSRNLTGDWLKEPKLREEDYILKSYRMVMGYEEKKAQKKSLLFAIPVFIAMAALLAMGKRGGGIFCLAAGAVLIIQYRAGYHLARKDVTDEMYLRIPQWLIEMILLLQNNNVQVALAKSVQGAPRVLQEELNLLLVRIAQTPGKLQAYTGFCEKFDLPELQSCMKMLHAVSENGTGNVKVQMNNLLMRVNEMQDMAEEIRNENMAFRMKFLFSYPVIGATIKLLIDLTIGMFVMFRVLGTMGGFS